MTFLTLLGERVTSPKCGTYVTTKRRVICPLHLAGYIGISKEKLGLILGSDLNKALTHILLTLPLT